MRRAYASVDLHRKETPLPPAPFRLAVIADAHFHDIHGNYGIDRTGTWGLTLRPLAEVARTPRAFNEAGPALRFALEAVAAEGIRDVVLLGDYSDDGQAPTLAGLSAVLRGAQAGLGLRFYALPGNHDVFADTGRDRSKRFVNGNGGYDLVTSTAARQDPKAGRVIVNAAMRCPGVEEGLRALPPVGLFGDVPALHWETPFGRDPAPAARRYAITSADRATTRRIMDASYLIEPVAGVWLLMLDANVWVPFDAADRAGQETDCDDSTLAGWDAVLRHKPFLLDWMADVARRAREAGKTLLTFSHYPVLDPFADSRAAEQAVMGDRGMIPRLPGPAVAEAVAATGVTLHVSGHLHLNATLRHGRLVNIAAPTLVAFPAAVKVLTVEGGALRVGTLPLDRMPMPAVLRDAYRREAALTGLPPPRLTTCETYGAFLAEHAGHLVGRRFLRREWQADLAALLAKATLGDLAALGQGAMADHADTPALTLMEDWYRLRMGSDAALPLIAPDLMQAYRHLSALHARQDTPLTPVFAMFDSYLARLPTTQFTVDLATGQIAA